MDAAKRNPAAVDTTPKISVESAGAAALSLTAMPGFPFENAGRMMVADALMALCHSDDEALWLVRRMIDLYPRWPGVPELRIVYCSKFPQPVDGRQVQTHSEVYPEGIPMENPERVKPLPALSPGSAAMVARIGEGHQMPKARRAIGSAACDEL